jgi:HEXXH motif-containing protein
VTEYHRLSPGQFAALAAGLGDLDVVDELNASRVSYHLLLLRFMVDHRPNECEAMNQAIATLGEVQQVAPQVYLDLVGDPLVGAWLTRMTRRIARDGGKDPALSGEFGQIGNLAAAAALRAGVDAQLTVRALDGRLMLPTLGRLLVDRDGPTPFQVTAGTALVAGRSGQSTNLGDNAGWQPHRYLGSGDCTIRIEDISRYRDGYHAPPSDRLTDDEVTTWQTLFGRAWRLLVEYLPGRAVELAAGLRVVVPLHDEGDGSARSGTARESVGALGLTPPHSPEDFVITLIHEYQHSKLSAFLDMTRLYEFGGTERHRAPWRVDRRPTSGLIQGVYAFLGVADAWRALRVAPGLAPAANEQFEKIRRQVETGYTALAGSAELTTIGTEFVAAMRPALDRLLAEPAMTRRS